VVVEVPLARTYVPLLLDLIFSQELDGAPDAAVRVEGAEVV
jgi:hypothetical protein